MAESVLPHEEYSAKNAGLHAKNTHAVLIQYSRIAVVYIRWTHLIGLKYATKHPIGYEVIKIFISTTKKTHFWRYPKLVPKQLT